MKHPPSLRLLLCINLCVLVPFLGLPQYSTARLLGNGSVEILSARQTSSMPNKKGKRPSKRSSLTERIKPPTDALANMLAALPDFMDGPDGFTYLLAPYFIHLDIPTPPPRFCAGTAV